MLDLINNSDIYEDMAKAVERDLEQIGRGYRSAKWKNALTSTAAPNGINVKFISTTAKNNDALNHLEQLFLKSINKNDEKYSSILANSIQKEIDTDGRS